MKKFETNELYKKYSDDVFNYSISLLKDYDLAKDAVQDVFIKFIDSENQFRGDCSYKSWLLVITRNYCYGKLRIKRKEPARLDDVNEIIEQNNFDENISLADAIAKLNHEDSEIIYLREYAGHSYKEMAEILETSIDNVKVKLFRVRKKLRKYLK